MATESSSNALYGGIYELSISFQENKKSGKELCISVCDDDALSVNMYSLSLEAEGEAEPIENGTIVIKDKDRTDFIKYLRQVADMLERKK